MLSPLTIESINLTDNWFCECGRCRQQITLDPDTARILLDDKHLVLIIDGCDWSPKGELVKEGEGFRIYSRIE